VYAMSIHVCSSNMSIHVFSSNMSIHVFSSNMSIVWSVLAAYTNVAMSTDYIHILHGCFSVG